MTLEEAINNTVLHNHEIIDDLRERAISPLLSICMKELRGKASGEEVNELLMNKINEYLDKMVPITTCMLCRKESVSASGGKYCAVCYKELITNTYLRKYPVSGKDLRERLKK